MLNKVILIGRLTRDPELRYTQSGVALATFTLAVDRPFTSNSGEREADFIRVVTWRKLAEVCANNLGKGRLVAVEGRIQVRSYQDQEGQNKIMTEVVGENVRFLDWPKDGQQNQQNQQNQQQGPGEQKSNDEPDWGQQVPPDDVPF
ncbi:single-stranded DNA-binding protein [Metallumcola ferriviriculae]|uniref:Single-stranded DNA-binding protein n=1 Tax=Metallumcola ferriviriculae TaxID=3039180 RepID=A0AAU0UP55_9FIRM|nr:single-stranded DNA-binding protein [Desulfitibacteraceae bacterium MK1]